MINYLAIFIGILLGMFLPTPPNKKIKIFLLLVMLIVVLREIVIPYIKS